MPGDVGHQRDPRGDVAGQTLTVNATGGGTQTSITFGLGTGQVSTLNELNTKLAANNLQATLAQDGTLPITTSNDAASATIGTIRMVCAITIACGVNNKPQDPSGPERDSRR